VEEALVRAVEVVQAFVHGERDVEETLKDVAGLAVEGVGASMAGLTIRDDRGHPTTVVHTERTVLALDQAQYDSDRGPCLDAARTHDVLEMPDARDESRWPEFAAAALEHGIISSLSVPVVVAADGLGALNFYDSNPGFFDAERRRLALLFAGQCAVTSQFWSASSEATNLARAMESRSVIEQAKGVIMATTGCDADGAFVLLREQSQQENRKLRDIASEIISRQTRGRQT
jgi:transcriptional regulator with GAF, ATPase, and Fis domain